MRLKFKTTDLFGELLYAIVLYKEDKKKMPTCININPTTEEELKKLNINNLGNPIIKDDKKIFGISYRVDDSTGDDGFWFELIGGKNEANTHQS